LNLDDGELYCQVCQLRGQELSPWREHVDEEASYSQLAKMLWTSGACSLSYVSFYEQFATLLDMQLWAGNKAAPPELHKALRGQWELQVQGQPLGGSNLGDFNRGSCSWRAINKCINNRPEMSKNTSLACDIFFGSYMSRVSLLKCSCLFLTLRARPCYCLKLPSQILVPGLAWFLHETCMASTSLHGLASFFPLFLFLHGDEICLVAWLDWVIFFCMVEQFLQR